MLHERLAARYKVNPLDTERIICYNRRFHTQLDHGQLVLFKEMQDFRITLSEPSGSLAIAFIACDEVPRHGHGPFVEAPHMKIFILRTALEVVHGKIGQVKTAKLLWVMVPIGTDIPYDRILL